MDKQSKKLELSKETLLSLDDQDLAGVAGGYSCYCGGEGFGGEGFGGEGLDVDPGGYGFFSGNSYEGILNSVACEDASLVCHIL